MPRITVRGSNKVVPKSEPLEDVPPPAPVDPVPVEVPAIDINDVLAPDYQPDTVQSLDNDRRDGPVESDAQVPKTEEVGPSGTNNDRGYCPMFCPELLNVHLISAAAEKPKGFNLRAFYYNVAKPLLAMFRSGLELLILALITLVLIVALVK